MNKRDLIDVFNHFNRQATIRERIRQAQIQREKPKIREGHKGHMMHMIPKRYRETK